MCILSGRSTSEARPVPELHWRKVLTWAVGHYPPVHDGRAMLTSRSVTTVVRYGLAGGRGAVSDPPFKTYKHNGWSPGSACGGRRTRKEREVSCSSLLRSSELTSSTLSGRHAYLRALSSFHILGLDRLKPLQNPHFGSSRLGRLMGLWAYLSKSDGVLVKLTPGRRFRRQHSRRSVVEFPQPDKRAWQAAAARSDYKSTLL